MNFDPQELMKSGCAWHRMIQAGKLVNGQVVVPDDVAQRILDDCRRIHGAGDIVAIVAQPIARAIDAIAGTNIANCGGCAKRRQAMNEAMPLTNPHL